jgi:predicted RNase H-like nuclease (RuvC/YqgF family)
MKNVSLKEHFDTEHAALKEQMLAYKGSQEAALEVAKAELNRRLEGMNEFRAQLQSQAATFLTRERFDANLEKEVTEHKALSDKIDLRLPANLYYSEHNELAKKVESIATWKAEQEGANARANLISIVAVIISAIGIVWHFVKP